ncbi:MAG: heat-inducible transcription repressor HrcA [Oscillibacter sp.]|nr:heat-inducible transcription repressor HrcA [Oscillibacter sp.]
MELTERKKQILKIVVEHYIRTAEPVGSKAIAAQMKRRVSPATIRNELAELTEMGYLEQPHTSAGRAPTPKGYRLYVDELMERQRLSVRETEEINAVLRTRLKELDEIVAQAGRAVASFMNYPAYLTAAGKKKLAVRRFGLIPVDEWNCIGALMLNDNRVKSHLLRMQLKVEPEQFPMLTNLLNAHFTEIPADKMGEKLMDLTEQIPAPLFLLLSQLIAVAGDALEEQQQKIVTAGARALLKLPEFRDAEKAHELMGLLSDGKEHLPVPTDKEPMKVLIGPENVADALKDTSVVVASYDIGEDMRGLVGVVGPTRMDYGAVIARLSGFADGLTRLLDPHAEPLKEDKET